MAPWSHRHHMQSQSQDLAALSGQQRFELCPFQVLPPDDNVADGRQRCCCYEMQFLDDKINEFE